MTRLGFRALCAAGLLAWTAGGALGAAVPGPTDPLDLTTYATIIDQPFAGESESAALPGMAALNSGAPPVADLLSGGSVGHLSVIDGVSFDLGAGTGARLGGFDAATSPAFDGLFLSASALNSPYAATGGAFAGLTADLGSGLQLSLGESATGAGLASYPASASFAVARLGGAPLPYDNARGQSLLAGVSLNFASWGGVGLTATRTSEQGGLFDSAAPFSQSANTTALGLSTRIQLGGGWTTTASFSAAVTKLDLRPGLGVDLSDLHSRAYGLAVAKRGLFGNDTMGFAVSRPAPGSAFGFDVATPRLLGTDRLLDGAVPETDFEVGYVTTFMDGAVALQTNAAYQVNFAGQSGTNSLSLLSRAKIKF